MTENFIIGRDYEQHILQNICGEFTEMLCHRNHTFTHFTKTKDALHAVLIKIYGLTPNLHTGSIYATIMMNELLA